jgi:putative transposase
LRQRLKALASTYVRYGYRRLTVLLRREGWKVNAKRIYRLYREEGMLVRVLGRPEKWAFGRRRGWIFQFRLVQFSGAGQ